jgi:hypothetical protein
MKALLTWLQRRVILHVGEAHDALLHGDAGEDLLELAVAAVHVHVLGRAGGQAGKVHLGKHLAGGVVHLDAWKETRIQGRRVTFTCTPAH